MPRKDDTLVSQRGAQVAHVAGVLAQRALHCVAPGAPEARAPKMRSCPQSFSLLHQDDVARLQHRAEKALWNS